MGGRQADSVVDMLEKVKLHLSHVAQGSCKESKRASELLVRWMGWPMYINHTLNGKSSWFLEQQWYSTAGVNLFSVTHTKLTS